MLHIFSAVIQLSNVEIRLSSLTYWNKSETLQSETKLETRFTGGKNDIRDDKVFSKRADTTSNA